MQRCLDSVLLAMFWWRLLVGGLVSPEEKVCMDWSTGYIKSVELPADGMSRCFHYALTHRIAFA
jgi:hypothetical protein